VFDGSLPIRGWSGEAERMTTMPKYCVDSIKERERRLVARYLGQLSWSWHWGMPSVSMARRERERERVRARHGGFQVLTLVLARGNKIELQQQGERKRKQCRACKASACLFISQKHTAKRSPVASAKVQREREWCRIVALP
jgi:hypothetical protein